MKGFSQGGQKPIGRLGVMKVGYRMFKFGVDRIADSRNRRAFTGNVRPQRIDVVARYTRRADSRIQQQ